MNEEILKSAYELKESLANDSRIITLNKLEKELENNEEVVLLSKKKDQCLASYEELSKIYPNENKEVSKALKELHEAKLVLDNHPLVREYLKAYKEVRELYQQMNEILFSDLSLKAK